MHWPLLAVELLTMALWASLIALLFGDWQAFHPSFPKDAMIILYVALACTFLPTFIAVLMQKYISAVSISFIYILEPVLGAVVALFYLHEVLPLAAYIGGGLVVVGAFIHTWGSVERVDDTLQGTVQEHHVQSAQSPMIIAYNSYIAPVLYCCSGFLILYGLGGFPPLAWRELAPLAPLLDWIHPERRAMASAVLNALLQGPQRQDFFLLLLQALCWFIGWAVLAIFVCMALAHILRQGSKRNMAVSASHVSESRRNELRPLQQAMGRKDLSSHQRITDDVHIDAATINAIWGGPLETVEPKEPVFNLPYDIGDITTDELPPILPMLSIPTLRRSGETHQQTYRVRHVHYEEQQREELA